MSWQTTTIRRGANHPLHLILTLATCGLWALVWIPVAIAGRRTVITGVHPLPYPPPVYGYGPVLHPGAPPRPQPPPAPRPKPEPPPQDDRKKPPW